MMDELHEHGLGSYITEFISGGLKNYAYRLYSPSTDQYHQVIKGQDRKKGKLINLYKDISEKEGTGAATTKRKFYKFLYNFKNFYKFLWVKVLAHKTLEPLEPNGLTDKRKKGRNNRAAGEKIEDR
uniref:Uncharacterized protein n=1 Tax=Romanomermis culicivorax TaxID=13658 RepID=A0A915IYD8_ROMCU